MNTDKDKETIEEIKDTLNRMETLLERATHIIEENEKHPRSVQVVNTVKTKNLR